MAVLNPTTALNPYSLAIGGTSLLAGLLGAGSSGGLSRSFFDIQNNQEAYNQYQQFSNPNSSLYSSAGRGFYNRLANAIPSGAQNNSLLASMGVSSPTVANMQRQAALRNVGTAASNYESDLFGRFQNIGQGYLGQYFQNQQFSKSAYANQYNADLENTRGLFGSLASFGGGLLGYSLAGGR